MDAKLLEKAVTEDTTGVLLPVIRLAYQLKPASSIHVIQTAVDTNKALGYELFDDLKYSQLVLDIARVARAVQVNSTRSK